MKVILQKDVARLGKKHQEVDVPNGYALNKLLPTGQAVLATTAQRQQIARQMAKQQAQLSQDQATLEQIVSVVSNDPLEVPMGANDQGHLFQAVSVGSIVTAFADRGLVVDQEMIVLPAEPIKNLGEHTIELSAAGVTETITVCVVAASI